MYWICTMVVRPIVTWLNLLQRKACLGITEVMKTAPTAAIEALLELTPLHLLMVAGVRAGIYRLYWSNLNGNPNLKIMDTHT
jgi:hypothetical protein